MNIETLATQGRDKVFNGLAGIDATKLKKLRNQNLRECFSHFEEEPFRLQFMARIHGMEFINDAISRTPNATWYSLETINNAVIWIANGDNNPNTVTQIDSDFSSNIKLWFAKSSLISAIKTSILGIFTSFSILLFSSFTYALFPSA